MSFEQYSLKLALNEVLSQKGFIEATPIQALAFDPIHRGESVFLKAQTGSGKTLAYLLPLLSKLNSEQSHLQVLVIAPTHELASQIQDVVKDFSDCFDPKLRSQLILGDTPVKRQLDKLKKKPHIAIGSLGRLTELIKNKKLKTHHLQAIVLDEADRLLTDKNENELKHISKNLQKSQTWVFVSATDNRESKNIVEKLSPETTWLVPEEQIHPQSITHAFFTTSKDQKLDNLRLLIKACKPTRAIIFAHHQDTIAFLQKSLQQQFSCIALLGNMQKMERQSAIQDFKKGKVKYFITTDLAARGLDIPDVSHIFQYDFPTRTDNYLHRAGRTGRMGKEGGCISLVTKKELPLIEKFEKELNLNIEALD